MPVIYLSDSYSIGDQLVDIPANTGVLGWRSIYGPTDISVPLDVTPLIDPSIMWSSTTGNGSQYQALLNGTTSVTTTIRITNTNNRSFDYFGIAGHNMHPLLAQGTDNVTQAFTVGLRVSNDGITWTDVVVANDNTASALPMFIYFNDIYNQTYIEFDVVLNQSTIEDVLLRIGHIKLGMRTRLTHPIFVGTTPLRMNDRYTYSESQSELGHFLGRTIVQKGMSYSVEQERTDQTYYNEAIKPFRNHFNGLQTTGNYGPVGTFFYAAQPIADITQIAYCHPGSFSAPENYHGVGLIKYSFNGSCE